MFLITSLSKKPFKKVNFTKSFDNMNSKITKGLFWTVLNYQLSPKIKGKFVYVAFVTSIVFYSTVAVCQNTFAKSVYIYI